ncbi:hypothetical protein M407DRAFT_19936 [Tulasnella calospora MUT 4182]|uniref:Retrotransposon gag domain-containing protein n=1 Tax=Tulasnella calospora MUT 4182 TaxID=1051891 RepID=A0A0C3QH17_9AGAM|nr:hypothetical protein M407DRAFT_19936 [Tulasnella calospora MUT 4182]
MSTPATPAAQDAVIFNGELNGITCEGFIRLVRTQAFYADKSWDYAWIAAYVSTRFDGPARRWYESLDDSVQLDWNALKNALLDEYAPGKGKSIRSACARSATSSLPVVRSRLPSPRPLLDQPYIIDGRIRVSYSSQAVSEFVSCINSIYVLSPNDRTALRVRVIYSDIRQSIATLNSRLQGIGLMSGKGLAWPASTAGKESFNHILEGWAFSNLDVKPLLFLKDPDNSLQTGYLSKLRLFLEPTHFYSI